MGKLLSNIALAPPDEYDWTVRVRQRCGLMTNYFDHLLLLCPVLIARYELLCSLYLYSWLIVYSDLCCFPCFFSLNYCFAAVVLIAKNKVEYIIVIMIICACVATTLHSSSAAAVSFRRHHLDWCNYSTSGKEARSRVEEALTKDDNNDRPCVCPWCSCAILNNTTTKTDWLHSVARSLGDAEATNWHLEPSLEWDDLVRIGLKSLTIGGII